MPATFPTSRTLCAALAALLLAAAAPAARAADASDVPPASPTFREGEVLGVDDVARIRAFLPPELWPYRDFFFYEGMRLEIGPFDRDYAPAQAYQDATRRFAGRPRIGPDGSLVDYVAGQPFPMEALDCRGDPEAGTKIIWNFVKRWNGDGAQARYFYSYWDRGEKMPLFYEGTSKSIALAHRVEPELLAQQDGDLLRGDRRLLAFGIEVEAPFDARGTQVLTHRYKSADGPRAQARNDDTWVYLPTLRRVRRISSAQRADAVSGTDFTFDDLQSFSGIPPQYAWTCLGEMRLLAPMNTRVEGYPYRRDHDFGPYGLSYADDRWELRDAVKIRMVPKNDDHPYAHKDLYLDVQTLTPLYSFAYDRTGSLWKILWHNHRWSGDALSGDGGSWYEGWEGVPEPRDLRVVSDTILNVQTGTGNRIEFWDSHGEPLGSRGRVRHYIDVGRLGRGH